LKKREFARNERIAIFRSVQSRFQHYSVVAGFDCSSVMALPHPFSLCLHII
jgi:hypothetical protein